MSALPDIVVDPKGTEALERSGSDLVTQARAIVITDDVTYRGAAGFLTEGVKALEKEILDFFRPLKRKAKELHDDLCSQERQKLEPVREAERIVKGAVQAYLDECERKRREEERRLAEEARKREEERQLREALDAAEQGDTALADAILEAPAPAPPPVRVAPIAPKVSGIAQRETWSAEVTDLLAFVKFVAANPQFLHLLQANQTALNQQARSLRDKMNFPGVVAVSTKQIAAGGRR